jgi:hypothetical protein
MYPTLLVIHSLFRWLVLLSLLFAIYKSYKGYFGNFIFTKSDDSVRHWTATIAHIQLIIGITIYTKSPIIKYFWGNFQDAIYQLESLFFGMIHIFLMLVSVVILTIGSAMAKRKTIDKEKFKTMLIWFSISLLIIFIAIPWSFSALAHRPYFRHF